MDKIEVSPRARRNAQALLKKIDCMGGESDDAEVILAFARFERDILATRTDATPVATDVAALVEAAYREGWRDGLASERPCSPYRTEDDDWADSDAFADLAPFTKGQNDG